jgi:cyclohexanone monooxygenase
MDDLDAVVVGAGFAGMYMLHKLRELGMSAKVFEAGDGVGGTWYWNRYPGARCDVESMDYSYSFSEELQKEWRWTERYPSQPEILRYANFVADKFDLKRDIQFETRVTAAHWDEAAQQWEVRTDRGDVVRARFCIMATGCLSAPRKPDFAGIDDFQGPWYHTGQWPHEGVDFTGQRVAVIGTGSSAIQSIPQIAAQATALTVFQRTANFSIPAHNKPLDQERQQWIDEHFEEFREAARASGFGGSNVFNLTPASEVTPEEQRAMFEEKWNIGGVTYLGSFGDLLFNKDSNDAAAEFVREKIRSIVKDPETAELLAPKDHPLGTKRLCVDVEYFETYNQPHVTLVSVRDNPIAAITPTGLRLDDGQEFEVDAIVFATGFDAMTGTLLRIDIRGRGGHALQEKWKDGPRAYLGIMSAGFPNLFMITGPGSPSVLSNMILSIEQHVEWLTELFDHMRTNELTSVDPTVDAEDDWVQHVHDIASFTLFPMANSWYVGANIPGKPRVFMPYIGGVAMYRQKCDDVVAKGYEGFELVGAS